MFPYNSTGSANWYDLLTEQTVTAYQKSKIYHLALQLHS